jgi:hypothetical protein
MSEVTSVEGVERVILKDGAVKLSAGRNTILVTRLKAGCLLITESGTQTAPMRAAVMKEVEDEIVRKSPISVFLDVRGSDRMDSAGREEWGAFGKRRQKQIARVVVLVRSKLLEMAFSVMGMFVGGGVIRMVASEQQMVEEIRREVRTFTVLPTVPG